MNKNIEVLKDTDSLITRAKELILMKLEAAIQARGRFTIALAGGGTPKPLYESLATHDLPWDKIHIFWGDERYVLPDHPDSNERMARLAWLNRVSIPATNIHAMPTSEGNPMASAVKYEQHLQQFFQAAPGVFPSLDVVLLGIGDDAHTASLFPHTEAFKSTRSLITVGNKDGQPRITFTYPFINAARCVMFVVAGANKQAALTQIFAASADSSQYPSRLIQPHGELWWLLDAAAGSKLEPQ